MTIDQPGRPLPSSAAPAAHAPVTATQPRTGRVPPIARVLIIGTALLLAAGIIGGLLVWLPWGGRDEFDYDSIAPIRDTAWLGIFLDGFAMAVLAITVSLATCSLASGRGARWAEVGAVLTISGGIAFAMGAFARGAVSWLATADSLGADAGSVVLTLVEAEPARLLLVAMAGFLLVTVGTLVLAVAWWRSRAVPRWLPIALAVLTVAQFTVFQGRALDLVQILVMLIFMIFAVHFMIRRRQDG